MIVFAGVAFASLVTPKIKLLFDLECEFRLKPTRDTDAKSAAVPI